MKRYGTQREDIISAGIDIGTSTTKVIVSKFSLMNMAGGAHLPRIEIIDKEIIHRSPIYRTPLLSSTTIDIEKVQTIVSEEFKKAGVQYTDIRTGAIIITGETATKDNAEKLIHQLSDHSGEFLVATAGPDLEGIIAAKGSGAYSYSKKTGKTVANIDIGGGTANIAVYSNGKLQGTCTLHIGGRLIEFENHKIKSISVPLRKLIQQHDFQVKIGEAYEKQEIKKITNQMSDILYRILSKQVREEDQVLLLGHEPRWQKSIETVVFSGGIGEGIHQLESNHSPEHEDDIGSELAASIVENEKLREWEWLIPDETVRATVLGAGTQTTEISGSTIQVDPNLLPIKNLPVYQISFKHHFSKDHKLIQAGMREALEIYDPQGEGNNFAIYLTDLPYMKFGDIQSLASMLLDSAKLKPNQNQPLVIVLQTDHAKVLGQTLELQHKHQPIICIDEIVVENGDYLDIGHLLQTDVVPVVVKTLTFQT